MPMNAAAVDRPDTQLWASAVLAFLLAAACQWLPGLSFFSVDHSAWQASDIVVASEGPIIDGRLTVQHSWYGDLRPGQVLHLPDLADHSGRSIGDLPDYRNPSGIEALTGQRIVLYLQRTEAGATTPWRPASGDDWRLSAAWIEGDDAFAYRHLQGQNYEVYHTRMNAFMLERRSRQLSDQHDRLAAAQDWPDPHQQAATLLALLPIDHRAGEDDLFAALTAIGPAAESHVLAALAEDTLRDYRPRLLASLATVGSNRSDRRLTGMLLDEYRYWRQSIVDLPVDWPTNRAIPYEYRQELRHRISVLTGILQVLYEHDHRAALDQVLVLRDFWIALPHLNNPQVDAPIAIADRMIAAWYPAP